MAQGKVSDPGGNPRRVLVVDPHATLRTVLAQRLRQDGHLTAAVGTAREALELCQEQSPDLLVSAELLEETSALSRQGPNTMQMLFSPILLCWA